MDIRKVGLLPNEATPAAKSSRRALPLGLLLVLLLVVGSVFASSNISINSGNPVALGAGVVAVTTCDDSIRIDAASEFQSDSLGFNLTNVTISEIATSSYTNAQGFHPGCAGTDLRLNFYHKTADSFEILDCSQIGYDTNSDISEGIDPSPQYARCIDTPDKGSVLIRVLHGDGDPAKYEIKNLKIDSKLVDSVSIISVTHDFPIEVGNIGPGGGTIFFVSDTPFTSEGSTCATNCHYLEFAPVDWHDSGVRKETTKTGWLTGSGGACWSFDTGQSTTRLTSGKESGIEGEALNWRIGSGMANTLSMQRAIDSASPVCTGGISNLALNYEANDNSKGQWFVPSVNEMNELCKYANNQTTGIRNQRCLGTTTGVAGFDHGVPVTDNPYVNLDYHSYWTSSASTAASGAIFTVLRGGGDGGDHFRGANSFVRPIRAF